MEVEVIYVGKMSQAVTPGHHPCKAWHDYERTSWLLHTFVGNGFRSKSYVTSNWLAKQFLGTLVLLR